MSTRSDFKMFSEAYDSIYLENEANPGDETGVGAAVASQEQPSSGPAVNRVQSQGATAAANTALQNLHGELQKLNIIDPTIQQHIQGIANILLNHQPPSTGQGAVA